MHSVRINRPRPAFGVFIALLYGPGADVDTDGDSFPANSREWTELTIKDRRSDDPCVDIHPDEADPAIFLVISAKPRLEELTALYLYLSCGESLSADGVMLEPAAIAALQARYDAELSRVPL